MQTGLNNKFDKFNEQLIAKDSKKYKKTATTTRFIQNIQFSQKDTELKLQICKKH